MTLNKFLTRYSSLIVSIVLFGQLGYTALNYYFGISGLTYFFGGQLCLLALLLVIFYVNELVFSTADLLFFALIGFIIINFQLIGRSNSTEFYARILIVCLIPYLGGKLIGSYFRISLFTTALVLSIVYIGAMAFEALQNPLIFLEWDRPIFFATEVDVGQGNAANIGITIGSAWIASLIFLILERRKGKSATYKRIGLLLIVVIFPLVLFFVGSRTSIVAILLSAFILLFVYKGINWRITMGLPLLIIGSMAIGYLLLPDNRKVFIDQLFSVTLFEEDKPYYISSFNDDGDSMRARKVLHQEAFRLFLGSPIWGAGSTNYGLDYRGVKAEFGSPHALLSHLLAENGIIGLGFFLLLILLLFINFLNYSRTHAFSQHPESYIIFGVWVSVLIQEQFYGNIYIDYHIFLLTGLASSIRATKSIDSGVLH